MDNLDKKIIDILQKNANLPVADIAKMVGLSTTPCWRRIQKLEDEGVIERNIIVLNQKAINLQTTVFIAIKIASHTPEWIDHFKEVVMETPEITDCFRISGNVDYFIRAVIPTITFYDSFYKKLITQINIHSIATYFVTETIKCTHVLPLKYMNIHETASKSDGSSFHEDGLPILMEEVV